MASLFCGLPASSNQDGAFMPGEANFSSSFQGGEKQVIVIPPRRRLRKSRGLTPTVWRKAFDAEGRLTDLSKLLGKIQRGGVDSSIRGEVWELLLGAWPVDSTAEERKVLRSECRLQYAEVLEQCRKIHPGIGSGRLAYAVNDAAILDARTGTPKELQQEESPAKPTPPLGKVSRNPLISSYDGSLRPSVEAPQPTPNKLRCNSFSGRISLDLVRIGSLDLKDLGWGAKFLFLIAEREEQQGHSGELESIIQSQISETEDQQGMAAVGRTIGGGIQAETPTEDELASLRVRSTPADRLRSPRKRIKDLEREALVARGVESFLEGQGALQSDAEALHKEEIGTKHGAEYPNEGEVPASELEEKRGEERILVDQGVVSSVGELMSASRVEAVPEEGATSAQETNGQQAETIRVAEDNGGGPELFQSHEAVSKQPVRVLGRVKTMVAEIEKRTQELVLEAEAATSKPIPKAPSARQQPSETTAISESQLEPDEESGPPTAKAFYGPKLTSPPDGVRPSSGEMKGQDSFERTDGQGTDREDSTEVTNGQDSWEQTDGRLRTEDGVVRKPSIGTFIWESAEKGEKRQVPDSVDGQEIAGREGRQRAPEHEIGSHFRERTDGHESSVRADARVVTDGQDASKTTDEKELTGQQDLGKQDLGLPFKALPLVKSKSSAVILNRTVSENPDTSQGDDESSATPGSQFTTFSTPDTGFFTPARTLSAFSTPKSAAYATPGEGFFTPDRLLRASSASPALSKSSAKPLIPKSSEWSARKGRSPLEVYATPQSAGEECLSAKEELPEDLSQSEVQEIGTVGGNNSQAIGNPIIRLDGGRDENIGEESLFDASRSVAPRTSRRLFAEGPDFDSNPASQTPPKEGSSTPFDVEKARTDSPQKHSLGYKERSPADLVLVVERGGALTALGQGPTVSSSFLRPLQLGRVSRTAAGLRVTWTSQESSPSLVVPRKNRLLNSSNQDSGPVEASPASSAVQAQTDELLTGPQAEKAAEWLWALHRIVIDVVRTDRHLEFFDETENLVRMADILAVYAWLDPDVGYCQGMSDLLSPFVVLFKDNADAFWCFERLMRRMRQNFGMGGPLGVLRQLDRLREIVDVTDPTVGKHLELAGVDNFLFAFRMLLVRFRRELSFSQALTLWEMMWAADFDTAGGCKDGAFEPPSKEEVNPSTREDESRKSKHGGEDDLCMYCVAAILHHNRAQLKREVHEMDDAVKLFNGMVLKVDVRACVESAIKRRKKFLRMRKERSGDKT